MNDKNKAAEGLPTPQAAVQSVQPNHPTNVPPSQDALKQRPPLTVVPLSRFLTTVLQPRGNLLAPIIQEQSVNMLYAWRGVGKTMIAIHMACAMASGGSFHTWKAPKPVKVLYLDGEMPAAEMQKRFKEVIGSGLYPNAVDNIQIVTPDLNISGGMPNLSTENGQGRVMELVADADIVIVDNISTLSYGGKENEAESWEPLQAWALKVRAMGKAVLFVHHANKSGGQRGTSKKEDIMDTVIRLDHPADYDPAEGARFNVTYDKCRNISGADTDGFEAHLTAQGWTFKSLADVRLQQVHELKRLDPNITIREISETVGIPRSTVHRLLKQAPPP